MNERPLKVLVVEDNDALREAFADQLRRDPAITTCEASTLVQGAKLARKQERFVVLIDLTLEDAKELEAVHVMKRIIPGATLVVVTGASEEIRKACLLLGVHGVIEKASPDSWGQGLIDAVRRAVKVHDDEIEHHAIETVETIDYEIDSAKARKAVAEHEQTIIKRPMMETTERIKALLKAILEKK